MNEKLQKYEEKMESALKHLNKDLPPSARGAPTRPFLTR